MLTGEIRSQIEKLRKNLWEGGVANPLTNVEQITYLLFIKRLDEIQTREEAKALALKRPVARNIFPEGRDDIQSPNFRKDPQTGIGENGCPYELMRWSRFRNESPERMYEIVDAHVMPFLRTLGGSESVMAGHMKGARLAFTKPALLDKLVQGLDEIPMDDRDTKGDVYEYLLSMISSAGENGQFRTPRHIIDLMVRLINPGPKDTICDPAAGTAGFLMMASEHVRRQHPELFFDETSRTHFESAAFTGFDFDETMLRIAAMNMMLHGIDEPRIAYRDSLAEGDDDAGQYTVILANPPFSGSLDTSTVSKSLLKTVNTGKTELLFIALFLRMLTTGGRAAVIVPNGVLEADSKAARLLREKLVRENTIEAIISLPHWIFKPYASVATSILIFTKGGSTERVMYINMSNDGFADDAKKTPIDGSQIESVIETFENRRSETASFSPGLVRFVDRARIESEDFDLCPRFYLLEHSFAEAKSLVSIGDLFDIYPGNIPAAQATEDGEFPFATSAKDIRRTSSWAFEGPAICIPTVSATGHGHAAIKTVHYVTGRFSAATITAVLVPKSPQVDVSFYYNILLSMKDEVLVSLMRGATNVTLNLDRLRKLEVPSFDENERSKMLQEITQAETHLHRISLEMKEAKQKLENGREIFKHKLAALG